MATHEQVWAQGMGAQAREGRAMSEGASQFIICVVEPDWRAGAVQSYVELMRSAPGEVSICFDKVEQGREVWQVPEIRAFCAALLAHQGVTQILCRARPGSTEGLVVCAMGKARFVAEDGGLYFLDIDHEGRITLNPERGEKTRGGAAF